MFYSLDCRVHRKLFEFLGVVPAGAEVCIKDLDWDAHWCARAGGGTLHGAYAAVSTSWPLHNSLRRRGLRYDGRRVQ